MHCEAGGALAEGGVLALSAASVVLRPFQIVVPAKAGIQRLQRNASMKPWMFGFAEVRQCPRSRE
ncbi:hypothetical protein bcgnr5380_63440 [Bacillus cereus]